MDEKYKKILMNKFINLFTQTDKIVNYFIVYT